MLLNVITFFVYYSIDSSPSHFIKFCEMTLKTIFWIMPGVNLTFIVEPLFLHVCEISFGVKLFLFINSTVYGIYSVALEPGGVNLFRI